MTRKASEGLRILNDHIGSGILKSQVRIDQPYAQDQHETMWYRHPRGGRAKYLEGPLFENHRTYFQDVADAVLDPEGPSMQDTMLQVGRSLRDDASENTPMEFGDLRQSGAVQVQEGTRIVAREPAVQGRLSESELDAKDYMRHAGQGYRS